VSRRALLIFAAIVLAVLGRILYPGRCFFTPFKVEPHLESGRESCTLLDVGPVSALRKKLGVEYLIYEGTEMLYRPDDKADTGVLGIGVSDDGGHRPKVLDLFRIHFDQPARVEGLTQADAPTMQVTGGGLPGGERADPKFLEVVPRWHSQILNLSLGSRIAFTDDGHEYSLPGRGYGKVVYSPSKDFFPFSSGDAEYDCTGYLQIYRRRDHRRLARFRIESCDATMGLIFYNMSWVSDRDFLYVTGFRSSDCFICRFEK